jgi:hypothetical protein
MMKSILLFILLPGCSIYLTAYSNESVSGPILGTLYVAGLLGTIAASVWFQGPWQGRLLKAGQVVFPMTFTIYMLGYFFENLMLMLWR